jgi:hypothetical protein
VPGEAVSVAALIEMLKREHDASKSVSEHLSFLKQLAQEPESSALRQSLIAHIGDEEAEHQAHLARLLPAIEDFERRFTNATPARTEASVEDRFTVGNLTAKRPWHAG